MKVVLSLQFMPFFNESIVTKELENIIDIYIFFLETFKK